MTNDVTLMPLQRSEQAVLQAIREHGGRPVSVAGLARATGYSPAAVTRARRLLRDRGLLEYESGNGHTPTRYRLPGQAPTRTGPPQPPARTDHEPVMLGGYHLGRTVSSGTLHLLDADGELPEVPDRFRCDTVCRPTPETAPTMEIARGDVDWDRLCRSCLTAIGAPPGTGPTSRVETTWQVQVWHPQTHQWLPIGRPHDNEPAARAARREREVQHGELRFRLVVRTTSETAVP
ncbi:MarR family transcriptional regulator [Streptomyces sp. NBC_00094]|uniref:MarR family transcriptional regulator n=1 Tax=Streptomyces sp. NBC_00094 TaxID=2903620 RepID=UPI002252FC2B|nr:MarR family transcriptional regulator [Streptomyces sp. NBC_00094]MCX5395255.1 MarR family transcriptional regulator [Streptomyces sp. NBC_00094]